MYLSSFFLFKVAYFIKYYTVHWYLGVTRYLLLGHVSLFLFGVYVSMN